MKTYTLQWKSVKLRIVQDLVEAGIITANESQDYLQYLNHLSEEDLLRTLLVSTKHREEAVNPLNYFPLNMADIYMS